MYPELEKYKASEDLSFLRKELEETEKKIPKYASEGVWFFEIVKSNVIRDRIRELEKSLNEVFV